MQLIQASTTLDTTQAMQMKFDQTLDREIKYDLALKIAQELMDSNQFIIQTQKSPPVQYSYSRNTITFFVELYIGYKKD